MRVVLFCLVVLCSVAMVSAQVVIGYLGNQSINASSLPGFGSSWAQTTVKYTWNQFPSGFCQRASQCLVSNLHNESFDDDVNAFFENADPNKKPKCIESGQHILDHYCLNGSWSSRTRLLAQQLLAIASARGQNKYELYCDSYDRVLNEYDYFTDYVFVPQSLRHYCSRGGMNVPCANQFCVLQYDEGVVVGATSNVPIDDPDHGLLLAFNKSATLCSHVSGSGFALCADRLHYDPDLNAVVLAPFTGPLPVPNTQVRAFFDVLRQNVVDYAFDYVHNPNECADNYAFLNSSADFDTVFVARNNDAFVFSQADGPVGEQSVQYAAWHFYNVDVPQNACAQFFKKPGWDPRVHCETQPFADEFFVLSFKGPACWGAQQRSVVDEWSPFTGGLRVVP